MRAQTSFCLSIRLYVLTTLLINPAVTHLELLSCICRDPALPYVNELLISVTDLPSSGEKNPSGQRDKQTENMWRC